MDLYQKFVSADEADRKVRISSKIASFVAENCDALFRIFHTIKGEAGFLNIATLGELTHNAESLLDLVKSGTVKADHSIANLLLSAIDLATEILDRLKRGDAVVFNRLSTA